MENLKITMKMKYNIKKTKYLSVVMIIICTFSIFHQNTLGNINYSQNSADIPTSSETTDIFTPYPVLINQTAILELDETREYYTVGGPIHLLFDFNLTDCFDSINVKFWDTNWFDYEDESRSNVIFEKNIINSALSRIVTHSESIIFNFTVDKEITSCQPGENSAFTVYSTNSYLQYNTTYNKTVSSSDVPSIFLFEVIKDYKYNITCNQTSTSALEFEFIYTNFVDNREGTQITDDLYESKLYNNGQFTAKTNATAFLMIHLYDEHEGTFNFNFTITSIPPPVIEKESISPYYTFLILIPIGVIVLIRRRKKLN